MRERLAVSTRAHVAVPTAVSGTADAGGWVGRYLRNAMALDAAVALAAGLIALRGRYDTHGHVPAAYIVLTVSLPVIWLGTLALAGAYEPRFIGAGADEFRRVINAGLGLTSAIAILSYATKAAGVAQLRADRDAVCRGHRPGRQVCAAQAAAPAAGLRRLHAPGGGGRPPASRG